MKDKRDLILKHDDLIKRFRKGICKSLDSKIKEQDDKKKSWMKFLNGHSASNTRPWA